MQTHLLGSSWTKEQIRRVKDPDLYVQLTAELGKGKELPLDQERAYTLPNGTVLNADSKVLVFSEKAASIGVSTGSAKIGDSLHHARLYAWKDKKGVLNVGMLRVFGAELPWLMRISGCKDALRVPIHPGSQSYRDLQDGVAKVIASGEAQEIGWITYNDELELDPSEIMKGSSEVAQFMKIIPEVRWRFDRMEESSRVRLRPILLSREEVPTKIYEQELAAEQLKVMSGALEKGARISVKELFSAPGTKIIRRDALGNPRWRSNGHVPVSLDIARVAAEKLGE